MSGAMRNNRVLFYVQHLLGVGHTMRAAALTRAMQRCGLDVTYVAGGFAGVPLDLGGAAMRNLPPVRAQDARFGALLDADGQEIDDAWRARRKAQLLDAYREIDPAIVLIEMFPFGRWPFRFELLPLLDAARGRARVVCSVRDILVPKTKPSRLDTIVDLIERYFDTVLVHGDPSFIRFEETFPPAQRIAAKLRYTGYVAAEPFRRGSAQGVDGGVVVSAGGGAAAGALMEAALAARGLSSLATAPWRFLTGPNMPAPDLDRLRNGPGAGPDVTIEPLRPDFRDLLAAATLSISQAGYNTVTDLLACGTRALLVPFSAYDQSEQAHRAARLARRGWARMLPEGELSARRLAAAIDDALAWSPPQEIDLDLDGARRSAALLAGLAEDGRAAPRNTAQHMAL